MRWLQAALPTVAIAAFSGFTAAVLWSAGDTLGYDYQAYVGAARRILDGSPMYDRTIDVAGGFAVFLYPPPFALALIPFALLPLDAGLLVWEAMVILAFVTGVAILPVSRSVRWTILLLAALDWPVLYAIKLGQVGPILFLSFAAGWRWLDRDGRVGVSIAVGALIKLQPLILAPWAVLTGRWRAALVAGAVCAVAVAITTLVVGTGVWADYASLLGRVASPVTTPHNFTPGAVAYQAGWSEDAASLVHLATVIATIGVTLVAIRTTSGDVAFLTTVVASQLLSPVLWDHYAVILLLPVAWLLARRQWWAISIPLLTALPMVGSLPPIVYPIVFGMGLVGPLVVERWTHRPVDSGPAASMAVGAP